MEQIGGNLRDTSNQSDIPKAKIKISAAAIWSFVCAMGGLLLYVTILFMAWASLLEFVDDVFVFGMISLGTFLGIVGLIQGLISLNRIKKSVGRLRGAGLSRKGIIISIIGLFIWTVFVLLPRISKVPFHTEEERAAKIGVADIENSLHYYFFDNGSYPTNEQGLESLLNAKKGGRYISKLYSDPWGRPFHYVYPGVHNPNRFDLWSNGEDGIEGTKDDITNFK